MAERLDAYLDWLAAEAKGVAGFRTLLLGGGYGRGEGGIYQPSPQAKPELYNDLEFYFFGGAVGRDVLERWAHEGEERLAIEIEFKAMSPRALERARPSMFYYDLLNRHILVAGEGGWLESLPADLSRAESIPPDEAGRLLVNRGMSLLRCMRWADGQMDLPEGFCDRITAKLKLALADAVLCSLGRYHWSCRERNARLSSLADVPPDWDRLAAWHGEGLAFKLHPNHKAAAREDWRRPLDDLRRAWLATFLWTESRRLGRKFGDAHDYDKFGGRLFPDEPALSNVLRQLRDVRRSSRLPFCGGDHPRSAIWRALALLMERGGAGEAAAARRLGMPGLAGQALEEHCRNCWRHYP